MYLNWSALSRRVTNVAFGSFDDAALVVQFLKQTRTVLGRMAASVSLSWAFALEFPELYRRKRVRSDCNSVFAIFMSPFFPVWFTFYGACFCTL